VSDVDPIFSDIFDDEGEVRRVDAGMFKPESLAALRPLLEARARGTDLKRLRQLTVLCGGPRNHAICEVYPGGIVYTKYFVRDDDTSVGALSREDRVWDEWLGRVRIESPPWGEIETVEAAGLLHELSKPTWKPGIVRGDMAAPPSTYDYGRPSLSLSCCVTITLDLKWLATTVAAGRRRRAVVPSKMRLRVALAVDDDDETLRPRRRNEA
jgi:hypothetical protein